MSSRIEYQASSITKHTLNIDNLYSNFKIIEEEEVSMNFQDVILELNKFWARKVV